MGPLRHAGGRGRFPVLLPLRARNSFWFGPTKHFRVGRSMANRRSINSKTLPKWVYYPARLGSAPAVRVVILKVEGERDEAIAGKGLLGGVS